MVFFLKLGGSLITDKAQPRTPRPDIIRQAAEEIAAARKADPSLQLVLGHGSGSFGHVSGEEYQTRKGVRTREEWLGFTRVWEDAAALNHLVMEALHDQGIPALAFPPSSSLVTARRQIQTWQLQPLHMALEHGLLPVVYGDVTFDTEQGGTILSTEEIFFHLAQQIKPERILLAGRDPGVWADYPRCTRLEKELTPAQADRLTKTLRGSGETDVTGGMREKVQRMLTLIQKQPDLDVLIFSGLTPGSLKKALQGKVLGTHLHA